MAENLLEFHDCYGRINADGTVEIGNSVCSRTWNLQQLLPPGARLIVPETNEPIDDTTPVDEATPITGTPPAPVSPALPSEIAFSGLYGEDVPGECDAQPCPVLGEGPFFGMFEDPVLAKGIQLTIPLFSPAKGLEILRDAIVYPRTAGIETAVRLRSLCMPEGAWRGIPRRDRLDFIPYDMTQADIECVRFKTGTDRHNDHVTVTRIKLSDDGESAFDGNILFVVPRRDDLPGFVLVKFSPSSDDRRDEITGDFIVHPHGVEVLGFGIAPHEISPYWKRSYSVAKIPFVGKRTAGLVALRRFLRRRWRFSDTMRPAVMTDPWGAGQNALYEMIGESFVAEQLDAGQRIGTESFTISDGWQAGANNATVQHGFAWAEFWQPHPDRFPHGMEMVLLSAERNQTGMGLWIMPNMNMQYADWEDFSQLVISLIDRWRLAFIRLTGITVKTREAEDNLHDLLTAIVRQRPAIRLILDTVNGPQPGYLYNPAFGPMQIEHRYCKTYLNRNIPDTATEYVPYKTLRAAWNLSHWLPPNLIQIDVPYIHHAGSTVFTHDRNLMKTYPEMPTSANRYGQSYCTAISLFFSPLLWLMPTKLPTRHALVIRELMDIHKKIREELWGGEILPFGDEPDGKSWSGFQSIDRHGKGYILLFRDNHSESERLFSTPFLLPHRSSRIAGTGTILSSRGNTLHVKINTPRSWGLWKMYGMRESRVNVRRLSNVPFTLDEHAVSGEDRDAGTGVSEPENGAGAQKPSSIPDKNPGDTEK